MSFIALFSFVLFSINSSAQSNDEPKSKMEYGIGVGLIYGDYHEVNNLPEGFDIDIDEARLSPSVNTYIAYRATDKVKITTSPGLDFHFHNEPFSSLDLSSVHLHLPIGVQHRLSGNLSIIGDIYYDYLINQSYEVDDRNISVTDQADTRNLFGASIGLAYSIGKYLEVQLTGSHQFNAVNTFLLTDINGNVEGDVKLRNRFLRLNFVFRG